MDMTANRIVDYSLDNSAQVVLNMLDEAIKEYEQSEFIVEEELFEELANIQ